MMTNEEMERKLGEVLEFLNQKADLDMQNIVVPENYDYVIETKLPTEEDSSWYRLYKSGWIEQGGMNYVNNASDGQTIPLIKTMDNTHYHIILTAGAWASTWSGEAMMRAPTNGRTINDFIYQGGQNNSSGIIYWQVSGQSA